MRKALEKEESALQNEEKKILARLAEIKKEKEFYAQNPDYELADILHDKLCHWNHVDGCGYHYEKWEDATQAVGTPREKNSNKLQYLKKANALLEFLDKEEILKVIAIIKQF